MNKKEVIEWFVGDDENDKRWNELNGYQKIATVMMLGLAILILVAFFIGLWWGLSHTIVEFEEAQQLRLSVMVLIYVVIALVFSMIGEKKEKEARK